MGAALKPLTYHSTLLIEPLTIVEVTLGTKPKRALVIERVEAPTFTTHEIANTTPLRLDAHALALGNFIASYYVCALGEAMGLFVPYAPSTIAHDAPKAPHIDVNITLSAPQEEALRFCQSHNVSLLFGDTGSGKTEIYMRLIDAQLSQGNSALFLMPEISLTPQMSQRLERHFGARVAIWHSKLTPKRKATILEGIVDGSIDIVAGPRSALFLPLQKLGIIIVDEEHDDSYKSSQKPRYHAKDMAIMLGKQLSIPVVLGSATPSLASYLKFPHYRLKGGYFDAPKQIVFENSNSEELSPLMLGHLETSYAQKVQSLVFVPTRANFKYLTCQSCHTTVTCPFCSVGMSVHSYAKVLRCHYCNWTQTIPHTCPTCKSDALSSTRIGTAQVVSMLQERFGDQSIALFDRDAIKTDTQLKKVLAAFNAHEIDTIVGTQMLSKGHDYHNITLGIILGIDAILAQSDYRAREKALSMLIQVIGRIGRKKEALVIIQSNNAHFFQAYLDDYGRFLEEEKSYREELYPPYMRLARLLFAHKNFNTADAAMQQTLLALQPYSERVQIVGAGKAAIEKIADKYRMVILLRSANTKQLLHAIVATLHPLAQVDIDPIEFN